MPDIEMTDEQGRLIEAHVDGILGQVYVNVYSTNPRRRDAFWLNAEGLQHSVVLTREECYAILKMLMSSHADMFQSRFFARLTKRINDDKEALRVLSEKIERETMRLNMLEGLLP